MANSGAPQPSTAVCGLCSPDSLWTAERTRSCNGCEGARYDAVSQPDAAQASSIAACLPEQFMRALDLPSPDLIRACRAGSSSGQSAGQPRAERPRPASSSMAPTSATWKSSPV